MNKKLIEKWFPIKEISRDAGIEMAYKSAPAYIKHARELGINRSIGRDFFDPKIRNLHPWFARRPCSVSRAITLASIFTNNIDMATFMDALGWNLKKEAYTQNKYPPLLFYADPKQDMIANLLRQEGKRIEEIVVCDPMAGGGAIPFESLRLGLKTVAIDYNPVANIILKATLEYPAKYGKKLGVRVREEANKLISYIEKNLGELYPQDTEGYIFARGIRCTNCGGHIPLIHDSEITSKYYVGFRFDKDNLNFVQYVSKIKTFPDHIKNGNIECPYCRNKMKMAEAYKIWTKNHLQIIDAISNGKVDENNILTTHVILIKQTKKGYRVTDERDLQSFVQACKHLSEVFEKIRAYLPMEEIPKENEVFAPLKSYGIKCWYQLFNPRQLLSLGYIVKYINEQISVIDAEDEIGRAAMVYLALGASRVIDYNSILTTWKRGTIRDTLGQYARNRKVSYEEAYCEAIVPRRNLRWIFEPDVKNKTQGGIVPVLSEICKRLDGLGDKITVFLGDARKLTSVVNEKFDLINVDPPYFDTHIYSDISEYFWQVLRVSMRALIDEGNVFNNKKIVDWDIHSPALPRGGELIVRKSRVNAQNGFDEIWYAEQMLEFFRESYNALKDDGLLVVWFTHRSLNAWKSIISALYGSNFYVTRIWPVTTELLTRLVAKKNQNVLDRTLIIVARKKSEINIGMKDHAKKLVYEIVKALKEIGTNEEELKTFVYAAAMCGITVEPIENNPIQYSYNKLIPASMQIAEEIIAEPMENSITNPSANPQKLY